MWFLRPAGRKNHIQEIENARQAAEEDSRRDCVPPNLPPVCVLELKCSERSSVCDVTNVVKSRLCIASQCGIVTYGTIAERRIVYKGVRCHDPFSSAELLACSRQGLLQASRRAPRYRDRRRLG